MRTEGGALFHSYPTEANLKVHIILQPTVSHLQALYDTLMREVWKFGREATSTRGSLRVFRCGRLRIWACFIVLLSLADFNRFFNNLCQVRRGSPQPGVGRSYLLINICAENEEADENKDENSYHQCTRYSI
jgi:hypothetical protein